MNPRKKIFKDNLFKFIIMLFSFVSVTPLFFILFQIVRNGISSISINFILKLPKGPGESGGGILNSIIGTFIIITIAIIISVPIGISAGIYLNEYKNRFAELLKVIVNVLQGLPSILIGIIAYLWVVKPMRGFSALSGGIALALMMLPMVIKSTEETLKLIPHSLKEASYALGVSYKDTILKVILPSGFSGIASGIFIGIARITGETAPLLFSAFGNPFVNLNPFKPVDAIPLLIFNYAMSPYESWHKIAWGASFLLVAGVLILNIIIKMAGEKWKVKF